MEALSVLFEEHTAVHGARIVIATLNAPQALNALSQEMIDVLSERLAAWREDPKVASIILRGAGSRALCAGGDIVRLYQSMRQYPGGPNPIAERFFRTEYRLDYTVHTYPKPILCWGHGIVMGGGLGLFAGSSHRVVPETSRIAMPELGIGLFPDVGATWFLNRMPGRVGLYLGLTGTACNAGDAVFIGLGDYFLPADQYESVLAAMLQIPWDDEAAPNHRRLAGLLQAYALRYRHELPASVVQAHYEIIERVTAYQSVEAIAMALQESARSDAWIARGSKVMVSGSPTSTRIFFEQYKRGKYLALKEAFRMELILAVQCTRHPDFAEGVRALLIDKDQVPQWQPPQFAEVSAALVQEHFTPPLDYRQHPLADL